MAKWISTVAVAPADRMWKNTVSIDVPLGYVPSAEFLAKRTSLRGWRKAEMMGCRVLGSLLGYCRCLRSQVPLTPLHLYAGPPACQGSLITCAFWSRGA